MKGGQMSKRKKKDIYEGYEPDWKNLQALKEEQAKWKKDHPNWTDEDAADYYAEMQSEIERGK